ncbi:MAG: ankyrin repeat domain-containing protein, partial [Gammaproteobacteria bacterium]
MKPRRIVLAAIVSLLTITCTLPAQAGVKEDFEEAMNAAKQRDLKFAMQIWRELAKNGHAKSQYQMGVLYRKGLGVEKNLETAYMWFRRAAEKGHPLAQYNLGIMYQKGWGTKRDAKEAEKWFRRAAKQDVAMAKEKIKNSVTDSISSIDKSKLSNKDRKKPVDINELLVWAAGEGRSAGVRDLVEMGADPNRRDKFGRTPLMEAAYNGHADTIEMLLKKGAQVNVKDGAGSSALLEAAARNHSD